MILIRSRRPRLIPFDWVAWTCFDLARSIAPPGIVGPMFPVTAAVSFLVDGIEREGTRSIEMDRFEKRYGSMGGSFAEARNGSSSVIFLRVRVNVKFLPPKK